MSSKLTMVFAAFIISLAPLYPSFAQDSPFMFQSGAFSNMMMQPNVDRMLKNNMRIARGNRADLDTAPVSSSAETIIKTSNEGKRIPSLLATAYPPQQQAQAESSFRELLTKYHQIEQQFGIPRHDLAGAVAAFLAGSYIAYHHSDFPDEHFSALVSQMRGVISQNPALRKASEAEKQDMYEQFAILGMFMAGAQMALDQNSGIAQAPEIQANLKDAGGKYLQEFLQADPAKVRLTSKGLEIR